MIKLDEQIINVKQQVENIKIQKIQLTAKLDALKEEKEKLFQECCALNVDPLKLDEVIQQYEDLIKQELTKIEQELKNFNVD